MFISPSSLVLNSTHSASGAILGNIHSVRAYPFPSWLPLSTPLLPPPNQSSTPTSSYTHFSSISRSPLLSGSSSTVLPSGPAAYPPFLGGPSMINTSSQSGPSDFATSNSLGPTRGATTRAGTSLPLSSPFSSNSSVSASLVSPSTAPTLSLSANPPSVSGFSFTSSTTSFHQFSETSTTRTFLSPTVGPSYSSPTGSLFTSSPILPSSTPSSTTATTRSLSVVPDLTTAIVSTTLVQSVNSPFSSPLNSPSVSTYTITSVLIGQGGTTTKFVTASNVLSTEPPGSPVNGAVTLSSGTIAAIVLGIVGVLAFSALWLFCACKRHRELIREATLVPPEDHAPGPLDDEILGVEELEYGIGSTHSAENLMYQTGLAMEEHPAGILPALYSTERLGSGNERASTTGIYGSPHDTATDMDWDDNVARASSPTLPLHVLPPDDPPCMIPLSPPPPLSQSWNHPTMQPAPPPSAYYMTSRRRSSPGPDAATCFGGYSVAPSCNSHYARSQTLGSGSGSGSGSVDALSRTRTGSEDPLLGISKVTEASVGASTPGGVSPTTTIDPGGHRPGLGSAFGSPAASMYSPSSVYRSLLHDTSGSQDVRTISGSGSYGYARSGTPSSFDVLRSVSSRGVLPSVHSQGPRQSQEFSFGFGRAGSLSSSSMGKKTGSNRHSFGIPSTSLKAWRDWGSVGSDKEKQGEKNSLREKDLKSRPHSWTSASTSASADEKQGRGSPIAGVRALFGRLRRAGHTPSPHSSSKDLPSATLASMDVDPEKAAADRVTQPLVQIEAPTPQRRRFSFILSNPDPYLPSPCPGVGDMLPSSDTPPRQGRRPIQDDVLERDPDDARPGGIQSAMPFPTGFMLGVAPSPVPTEELHLTDGLLHPRLQTQGRSDASLRDFEDYSRPIGGVVKNRLYSTTTFGTQDEIDRSPSQGTQVQDVASAERGNEAVDVFGSSIVGTVPRDGWFGDDHSPHSTTRHSPIV